MYAYIINYPSEQEALCALEMRRLFQEPLQDVIFSNINYSAGRSAYFKAKLDIYVASQDLNHFLEEVGKLTVENFKVNYIKLKNDALEYKERMQLVKDVAKKINGKGSLDENVEMLGIMFVKGYYYLGALSKDHQTWQLHQNKPQSYSQSLSAKDARTLVNIATGGKDIKIVDPCCGVGTVLLEALEMNYHIDGYEIHPGVTWKGNRNLEFFGYEKLIQNKDMHTIEKHYDVAILDIPYNLYSSISKEQQFKLIETCHRIADYFVLISYEKMDDMLRENHFKIIDMCKVTKIKMQRYIYYCEVEE